jgi:hypothetical protein
MWKITNEEKQLGEVGMNKMAILKFILQKYGSKVWTGLNWLGV